MSQSAANGEMSRTADLVTEKGVVHIRTHCPPDFIDSLDMDEGIGVFPHYRSIVWDKHRLREIASLEGANLVLAYTDDRKIIGYIPFAYPSHGERWGRNGEGLLYELGSIEVSKDWRRLGISGKMAHLAMDDDWIEDKIVFITGYSWHWDLEGTGLRKPGYRKMLMHIFEPYGFRHFYTTEPNINMDPANMLMVRIGARVSEEARERFLDLAFSTNGEDNHIDNRF